MDRRDIGVRTKPRLERVLAVGRMDRIAGILGDSGRLRSEVSGELEQWQLLIERGVEEERDRDALLRCPR